MKKKPEFDKFAHGYSGGEDVSLLRMFGDGFDQFVRVKAKWLWDYLHKSQDRIILNEKYSLLDYGCGTGEMLKWLQVFGFPGQLHGADVSPMMLAEAKKRWNAADKPLFSCIAETKTDFADNSFSCIIATCVFHHIEPEKRDIVLKEINRILVPGGIIVIFEHNPLNPLTRLIVKRAVVDRNAILLYPAEVRNRIYKAFRTDSLMEYLLFFPPKIEMLYRLEKYLSWCPLGGQYVVIGRKNN